MYKNPTGPVRLMVTPTGSSGAARRSLSRLGTEVLDLFYLHRVDHGCRWRSLSGAIDRLISDGKVRYAGLSEVSRSTLERAMSVTKIHALQSEYSLWSRRVEDGVLGYCKKNRIALVAYSPVGRGFLAGGVRDMARLTSAISGTGCPFSEGMRSRTI